MVASWVNVADVDDVVALRKQLKPLFPPPSDAEHLWDKSVDNGDMPHDVVRYLNTRETGSALATAF